MLFIGIQGIRLTVKFEKESKLYFLHFAGNLFFILGFNKQKKWCTTWVWDCCMSVQHTSIWLCDQRCVGAWRGPTAMVGTLRMLHHSAQVCEYLTRMIWSAFVRFLAFVDLSCYVFLVAFCLLVGLCFFIAFCCLVGWCFWSPFVGVLA